MSRDDLENLLRNHLSGELDSQRGRAARDFDTKVIKPMQLRLEKRNRQWTAMRSWSLLGTAMAACIVVGYTVPHFFRNYSPTSEIARNESSRPPIEIETVGYQQTSVQKSIDAGPVILSDNTPGRKIILQEVKRYNWNEPTTGGRIEIIEPTQKNLYLPVHQQ